MPKSTGPLQDQILGTSQASSTPAMTDSTTSAADKLGANKATNAIPQEVRRDPTKRAKHSTAQTEHSFALPYPFSTPQANAPRTHQSSPLLAQSESSSTPTAQSVPSARLSADPSARTALLARSLMRARTVSRDMLSAPSMGRVILRAAVRRHRLPPSRSC